MNLSPKGAAFIRGHEGFVARYYLDPVGVPTIGIGFTWRSQSFQSWWAANKNIKFGPGATMTRAEAEHALIYLCAKEYGRTVNEHYAGRTIAQHVFDASTSVVYNCGAGTLSDRWAQAAKKGHYATAADYLETTRVTAKGKRLAGLVRRRKEEAALLEYGRYGAVAAIKDAMSDGILERGEGGPFVAALIRDLQKLGFYNGKLDDVYGYGTEEAVLAFQRSRGLTADGIAGPKTLAAVAAAMAAKPKRNLVQIIIDALMALFGRK